MKTPASLMLLLALALPASAQITLQATLSGSQEVPPNASTATGFGTVTLNAAQNQITITESWIGLSANPSATHIHGAAPTGVNAGVIFSLTGITAAVTGAIVTNTFSVTPQQAYNLLSGLCYFNVHNASFPGGEIRGQILAAPAPAPIPLTAVLNGNQEVPTNASTATGFGNVILNAAQNEITVMENWSGLTGNPTATHIHGAAPTGVNAGVIFSLTGVTAAVTGSIVPNTFAVTPQQAYNFLNGLCYFNVHTTSTPGGEIRGQILNRNAIAAPVITGHTIETNGLRLVWTSALGRTNALQRLATPASTNYVTLHSPTNQTGLSTNFLDTTFATNPAAFYRIQWLR